MLEAITALLSTLKTLLSYLTGAPQFTPWATVPARIRGSAYASGDAFGLSFPVDVPRRGIIYSAHFLDFDNEKLGKDFVLFAEALTTDTADDSAWALAAADAQKYAGTVSITAGDFIAANANAIGEVKAISLPYEAPLGKLWVKCVTRGADNLIAGVQPPMIRFGIL